MNSLSLCEFVEDVNCHKDMSLYETLLVPAGTSCVYLRLEENKALAQIIFEGIDGIWRAPIESIMFVSRPKIHYQTKEGLMNLKLGQQKISLHKEM